MTPSLFPATNAHILKEQGRLTCIQTYDLKSIPSLVATLRDLFELSRVKILISATVRNEQTLGAFTIACGEQRIFDYPVQDFVTLIGQQGRMASRLSNLMYLCLRKNTKLDSLFLLPRQSRYT